MKTTTATAIAALGLLAPGWAGADQDFGAGTGQPLPEAQTQPESEARATERRAREMEPPDARLSVLGRVTDARQVELDGAAGNAHYMVKLETEQGDSVIADLGTGEAAAQVQEGDRILVVGRSARINDKPVVFAKYFGEMQPAGRSGAEAAPEPDPASGG